MTTIYDKCVAICERLGWNVDDNGDNCDISKYTNAGEDFSFNINKNTFIADVVRYAYDFDVDEHMEMWIEARHNGVQGVPYSNRILLEDSEEIADDLDKLAEELGDIENDRILC